jgi:hypothetical protein
MAGKSQEHRKQKQRKNLLWLVVVLGGGLFLIAAVLLATRGGGDGSGSPSLTVDQNKIDYGYVKFGENRQFAIKVGNSGDGTLRFKEDPYIEVLEGC